MPKKTFAAPPSVPPPTAAVVAEPDLPEPAEPEVPATDAALELQTPATPVPSPETADAPSPAIFPNLRIINRLTATSAFQSTLALIQAKTPQSVQSQLVNVGLRVSTPLLPVLHKFDKEIQQLDNAAVGALDTLESVVRRGQEAIHLGTTAAVDYVLPEEPAAAAPEATAAIDGTDGTDADVEEKRSDAAVARLARRLKKRRDVQLARISRLNETARQNVDASVTFVYQHASREALLNDAAALRACTQSLVQSALLRVPFVGAKCAVAAPAGDAAEPKAAAPAPVPLFPSTLTPAALVQLWLSTATSVSTATKAQALRAAAATRSVVTATVLPPAEGKEDKRPAIAKSAETVVRRTLAIPVVHTTTQSALALGGSVYGRLAPLIPEPFQPHALLRVLDEATKDVTA